MADPKPEQHLVVRHNNNLKINWKVKNWVVGTQVQLTVDPDPGAKEGGAEPVPLGPAPEGLIDKDGNGFFGAEHLSKVGTFLYKLTLKKKPFDEVRVWEVKVQELHYAKFEADHAKVWMGEPVTLKWSIEATHGATFQLETTGPDLQKTLVTAPVDKAGNGSLEVKPAAAGAHQFKLLCTDPTIAAGQKTEDSPIVTVTVRKEAPGVSLEWADAKVPSLLLTVRDTLTKVAPGYEAKISDSFAKPNIKKACTLAKTGGVEEPGQWEALLVLEPVQESGLVKVFKSLQAAKAQQGQTPLLNKTFWFKKPDKAGDPPTLVDGPPPDHKGKLDTPSLPAEALKALSPKRRKIVDTFLTKVMPSEVGSAAFDHLQTKDSIDKQKVSMPNYTTCVTVPSYLSLRFGEQKRAGRFSIGGIAGCYWAASDSGGFAEGKPAWVTARPGLVPKPGDLFLIAGKGWPADKIDGLKRLTDPTVARKVTDPVFECLHVGVIIDTDRPQVTASGLPLWLVANAGQANNAAAYTLGSVSKDKNGDVLFGARRLGGWVDADNYLPWDTVYKVFKASAATVAPGKPVTLSWSITGSCSPPVRKPVEGETPPLAPACTYQLVTTKPDGSTEEKELAITVAKMVTGAGGKKVTQALLGVGELAVKQTAPGVYKYRIKCLDSTLEKPEGAPMSEEVVVEVK